MIMKAAIGMLGAALFIPSGALGSEEGIVPGQGLDQCILEIRELKVDINLLNLINGLYLTEALIKALLKEAKRLEKDLRSEDQRGDTLREMDEEIAVLRQVRDRLQDGKKVPLKLKSRYEVMMTRRSKPGSMWRKCPQVAQRVEESTRRVAEFLTPAQREVLSTFKSCLIPPRDLKNPVRVGQAGTSGRSEKMLEKIRTLPEAVYQEQCDKWIDQYIVQNERYLGEREPEEKRRCAARVLGAFEQVRGMDDVEFLLNVSAIAESLAPVDRVELLQESLVDMGVLKFGLEGRIVYYLLSPPIIPLLTRRLQLIRERESEAVHGTGRSSGRGGIR